MQFKNITVVLLLLVVYVVNISEANSLPKVRVKDGWFVDQDNRVLFFHGINSVQKNFPWVYII